MLPWPSQNFCQRVDVFEVVREGWGIFGYAVSEEQKIIHPLFQWADVVYEENGGDCVCESSKNIARASASEWADVVNIKVFQPLDDKKWLL
jgi:hypothetical protein